MIVPRSGYRLEMTQSIRHGARDSRNSHLFFAWQATASSSGFALRARLAPGRRRGPSPARRADRARGEYIVDQAGMPIWRPTGWCGGES
jgi:hypothetical protein